MIVCDQYKICTNRGRGGKERERETETDRAKERRTRHLVKTVLAPNVEI